MSQKRSQPLYGKRAEKVVARALVEDYLKSYSKARKQGFLWNIIIACLDAGIAVPPSARAVMLQFALKQRRKVGNPNERLRNDLGLAMAVYHHWSGTRNSRVILKWTAIYADVATAKSTSVASVRRAWKEYKALIVPSHVLKNEMGN